MDKYYGNWPHLTSCTKNVITALYYAEVVLPQFGFSALLSVITCCSLIITRSFTVLMLFRTAWRMRLFIIIYGQRVQLLLIKGKMHEMPWCGVSYSSFIFSDKKIVPHPCTERGVREATSKTHWSCYS